MGPSTRKNDFSARAFPIARSHLGALARIVEPARIACSALLCIALIASAAIAQSTRLPDSPQPPGQLPMISSGTAPGNPSRAGSLGQGSAGQVGSTGWIEGQDGRQDSRQGATSSQPATSAIAPSPAEQSNGLNNSVNAPGDLSGWSRNPGARTSAGDYEASQPSPLPLPTAPPHEPSSQLSSRSNASGQPGLNSQATAGLRARTDVTTASHTSPVANGSSSVVTAQFTSSDRSFSDAVEPAAASTSAGAKSSSRPLRPPTESMSTSEKPRSSGTVQMFISVISSLLIVIGLLLGAAWLYRKATPGASSTLPKHVVQVLGRTQLAPRQQLMLLRFGSKLVLVSNLQGEVRTVSEITDPLEVDHLAGMCESAQAGSISDSFRNVLHNIGRSGT